MTRTDSDCIKLCLNGHPDAYQQLVRHYQAPLLSYLAGRLGDVERAEEAAQETFVRAFFALSKLNSASSFLSWLFGIGKRVAQEQQRSERRYRQAVEGSLRESPAAEPSHDYALERAVAELPEAYSEIVFLRYYGGLSCGQVAERLDVPLGTVTKRLSRAYGLLRESLRQHERRQERGEV
ncbi:MAG: RNA polymerase sigma factor [Planctomycetota bacterium]